MNCVFHVFDVSFSSTKKSAFVVKLKYLDGTLLLLKDYLSALSIKVYYFSAST